MTKSQVQQQIIQTANQAGIDPKLALAVAQQESGYQQYDKNGNVLTSPANAIGIMQLIPSTAASLGVDPNDPVQNIQGGVALLAQLLRQFNGDTSLALAAYNAGPTAVRKYNGIPPYPETQQYVPDVLAIMDTISLPSDSSGDSGLPVDTSSTVDTSFLPDSTDIGIVAVVIAVVSALWLTFS